RGQRLHVLVVKAVQARGLDLLSSHACWASGAGLSSALVKLKVLAFLFTAGGSAASALWTFPSILGSAFLVAWGAEAAQFLISQGLALAILAWLQTLPEFAVEAVIAWEAGRDPERAHLAIAYLWVLFRNPPHNVESLADTPAVSRWAYRQPGWRRPAAIIGLFGAGGVLLYVTAHPFLESMLAVAGLFGVSQFVLVQWVAPFLSEFPEKVSAFYWARRVTHAPMALMNMVSSNINQWTVLAAMIPLVYGYSHLRHHGVWVDFHFDQAQRLEVLITLFQTALGMLLLAKMEFAALDAAIMFVLWLAQFLRPSLRDEVTIVYGAWMAILVIG